MNDDDMLTAVRNSLTDVKESLSDVCLGRSTDAIWGRARSRRLRRGLSAAGAGTLAVGIGLALALSPAGGPSVRPAVAGPGSVHVNLDAWSVNTTSTGIVDVTIRELRDPALLRKVLAEARVPAVVSFGKFCYGDFAALAFTPAQLRHVVGPSASNGTVVVTINPAAMPAGSELIIGAFDQPAVSVDGAHVRPATIAHEFSLIKVGTPLTCQSPVVHKKSIPTANPSSTS